MMSLWEQEQVDYDQLEEDQLDYDKEIEAFWSDIEPNDTGTLPTPTD